MNDLNIPYPADGELDGITVIFLSFFDQWIDSLDQPEAEPERAEQRRVSSQWYGVEEDSIPCRWFNVFCGGIEAGLKIAESLYK